MENRFAAKMVRPIYRGGGFSLAKGKTKGFMFVSKIETEKETVIRVFLVFVVLVL